MSQFILGQALDGIVNRLSAPEDGFNRNLAITCEHYGIDPYEIDFREGSSSFFDSQFDVGALYELESAELPAICCYEQTISNANLVVGLLLSGPMAVGIDVHLVWENPSTFSFGRLRRATFDAMLATFNTNSGDIFGGFQEAGITYNGVIGYGRPTAPILDSSTGDWMQTMPFGISFKVFTC